MCEWKPPEDMPWWLKERLENYKCTHKPEPGRKDGLCIFHIPLEEKNQNQELRDKFREEWWKLYDAGEWDFLGFKFPDDFNFGREEEGERVACDFRRNEEVEEAENDKNKRKPVNFTLATFGDSAYFISATFGDSAYFGDATFGDRADFSDATFGDRADFSDATFGDSAYFSDATFGDRVYFIFASFGDSAYFSDATFGDSVYFISATFGDSVYFISATFGDSATWSKAVFEGKVDFSQIKGRSLAYQVEAGPKGDGEEPTHQATYHSPEPSELIFESTRFQGPADFSRNDLSNTRFQLVDLSNISFLHSQISETKFISCKWGRGAEAGGFFHRKVLPLLRLKRTRLLFDELIFRKKKKPYNGPKRRSLNEPLCAWRYLFGGMYRDESDHEPIDDVNVENRQYEDLSPGLIEVLALQLKQSLEATKDPIAAGDFHFCAMEMKRLRAKDDKRGARAKVLWWYKMLNGYGERYGRTLMWLGWLLAIFSVLFAWQGEGVFKGGSFWGRLEPAAFYALQHVLPFKFSEQIWKVEATHTAMRWLSFIETFIGTSLFAFFLLALRRRFKR